MLEKLKKYPEARRSLGIGAGVFIGLLAYRLVVWAFEWWTDAWVWQKEQVIEVACAVALLATVVWAYRRFGKSAKRLKNN